MTLAPVLRAVLLATPLGAFGAPPLLDVADGPIGLPGSRVAPNLLLHMSLTFADAGAAYRDEYTEGVLYAGYFNPRLCYSYPPANKDPGSGYFSPLKDTDAKRRCGGNAFSGNLLNWAGMSRLDLLRLALTGGDRVIDEPGLTVLQRAWLPDGTFHPDFHAHRIHFPRKTIKSAGAVTPFGKGTLYIVSCRNRILFSDSPTGGSCDKAAGKSLGEFNVRVKVCDKADSELRPQLCARYKDEFKPEGAIQENAGLMRIGAMGYLVEQGAADANFYGGVLRAPLKAPVSEWDRVTGVLEGDPDKSGGAKSGLINFLNLSGRRGAYKETDPGAELFYEGLRYLQGRAPSSGGGDGRADDGLPVWSARADPMTESCQRSTVAMIGHSSFVRDRYLPGNTKTDQGDAARPVDGFHGSLDVMRETRRVGELESISSLDVLSDGPDGAGSFYLAGAAYWAHTNALRSGSEARVDTLALELDLAPKPNASPLYLAAKYGAFLDKAPTGYFSAADPHALVPSVRELFAAARHPRGEVMAGGASAGQYMVQASYDRQQSSGTLRRYGIARGTDGGFSIATVPAWDAAQALPSFSSRKIYTSVYDADGRATTVEFKWAGLPQAQRDMFDIAGDGEGEAMVDYLRGDRSRETGMAGGIFRRRASALGDIVRSVPAIVGKPSASVQGAGYINFHASASKRRAAVYAGANDGMLHAFDAVSGVELFAYVPNALHSSLAQLSRPGYRHRPYVDASPGRGEALVSGKWRTVLASGMGMGARGVFALDVTDPTNFAGGRGVLWEFTENDDAAIGHVTSAPTVGKFRVGTKEGKPAYRYFVVVASGINNYTADDDEGAARGALFLLSLDKPASERWKRGVNYYKLITPLSESTAANALAPPGFALAPDGSVRYAYAGDLQGNVWRFDFGGKPPWTKAVGPGPEGKPLFVARDASGNRQSLTHAPRVVFAPGGGYLVLFGTGRLLENPDLEPSGYAVQSFYAIRDSVAKLPVLVDGRSELARRSVSGTGPYVINGDAITFEGKGARKGWYLDLPNWRIDGERSAASPLLVSGAVVFDTLAPGAGVCAVPVVRTYVLDALSGLAYSSAGVPGPGQVTGDVVEQAAGLTPPVLFDMGMAAGQRDATGASTAAHSVTIVRMRSGGKPALTLPVTVKTPAGRLSWREVANWQELHEAAKR